MTRFLPPLLVLLVFAGVALRCALEPSRAEAREQISGMVQGGAGPETVQRVEAYLARFDDDEDIWFATWVWFRLMLPERAIEEVWDHPTLPGKPGTARRFAQTALEAAGWEDEARRDATMVEPFSLVALAEGDNPWAHERLRSHVRERDLMGTTSYFFPAYRRATSRPLRIIVEEMRKRGTERFDVAAAIGSLRGQDYPYAERDEAKLVEVVSDDKWRRTFRDVWCVSALALGRSGTPAALAALAKADAELEGSVNELDKQDRQLVNIGKLASGDWSIHDQITPYVYAKDAVMIVTVWYLEALIHRYLARDPESEVWLRRMWEGPGARFQGLRGRIARAFLLQDAVPDDGAMETWVGRMLGDLERPDAPVMSHVLAASFRLRKGFDGSRAALVELLRSMADRFAPGTGEGAKVSEPFIEALRGLYLYG